MAYNPKRCISKLFQGPLFTSRHVIRYCIALSLAFFLILGIIWLRKVVCDQLRFPIYYVKTIGVAQHQITPIIKKAIEVSKSKDHRGVHLPTLEAYLRQSGWVNHLVCYHWFPWTLIIDLSVREPVAIWQGYGDDVNALTQWVDCKGTIFKASPAIKIGHIPILIGKHKQLRVLLNYQEGLDALLKPYALSLASVHLDEEDRCSVKLTNGMQLLFGHCDPHRQLQQLLCIHPSILHQAHKVAMLDLRYPTGMAITWRAIAV